jgi:hypothetical protein
VFRECLATHGLLATTDFIPVATGEIILHGYAVTVALDANTIRIENGAGDVIMRVPSSPLGFQVVSPVGIRLTGLTINPDDAAGAGELTVFWQPA